MVDVRERSLRVGVVLFFLAASACGDDSGAQVSRGDGGSVDAGLDAGGFPGRPDSGQSPVEAGSASGDDSGVDSDSDGGDGVARAADQGDACDDNADCEYGHCVDGVCCESACGGGTGDCQACAKELTGRPDGVCAALPAGNVCRASQGGCDFAEVCDGSSRVCPGDVWLPMGIVCRAAADLCDAPETCTGTSPACPDDDVRAAGTLCRPAAGPCDIADECDGASPQCPNAFQPASHVCNGAILGSCDAPDQCTGESAECPPTYLPGVECRGSAGACDIPEICSGSSPLCPSDEFIPAGVVCRKSTNLACDPLESCDGVSAACPADIHC